MQLCAGFILHFVAVLAPFNARNATVSHTPLVPKDCSGLSMLVVWERPKSGEEASLLFLMIGCQQGKAGKIELLENADSDLSSKILSTT